MTTVAERPQLHPDTEEPAARGDRFVATALLVVAVAQLALQVIAGHVIPPVLVFAAVYLVLAAVVARHRRRWVLITAIVVPVAHLVGSVPFMAEGLAHPESPVGFLFEVIVLLGVVTAVLGATASLRGAAPARRRPIMIGVAAVGAVAVAVSAAAAAGVDDAARQDGDVVVEADGEEFPDLVEVPAGGATLWVDNRDPFHHTIVIEGSQHRTVLPAGTSVRVDVDLAPGTYRYLCDVPGHETMEGELIAR